MVSFPGYDGRRVPRIAVPRIAVLSLLLWMAGPALAAAELKVDAAGLDPLPAGWEADPGVRAVSGGILCDEGGLTLPVADQLTAAAGTIHVRLVVPEPWAQRRSGRRRTLVHMDGDGGAINVSAIGGTVLASYRAGDGEAWLRDRSTRGWEHGSVHEVTLTWYARESNVVLMLRVDGRLAAVTEAPQMPKLSDRFRIGARGDGAAWGGVIEHVVLSPDAAAAPELAPGSRTIRVHADQVVGECYRFWAIQNMTEAYKAIDPQFIVALDEKAPFSDEVTCVYLLGGRWPGENEWFKGVDADGTVRADFSGMIAQLRGVLDGGYVPHIILDNVPPAMSDPPQQHHYGNTAPAADLRVWREYVRQAVVAMVDAFGRETVSGWTFRVGTEPDLRPAHWAGTREEYFAHYDYTVDAVSEVLPEAKIGPGNILNPSWAMSRDEGPWGLDIINHAATGVNAATGEVGTRMDFFSCSWYGRLCVPISDFDAAVEAMRNRLGRYPQFADLPLHIGEHAVLGDEYGRRLWAGDSTEWGASFFAAFADRVYAHNVEYVYEWDHATSGVMHPKGHVLWMLERMLGGDRLAVDVEATSQARSGAIAAGKDGRLYVLVYNHRPWRDPKVAETVRLEIRDPRMAAAGRWTVTEWTIDRNSPAWAYAYEADCEAAGLTRLEQAGRYEGALLRYYGEPGAELFHRNIDAYRRLAEMPPPKIAEVNVDDGQAVLEFEMPGHSVRLLELAPAPRPTVRIETSMGDITVALRPDKAPATVANFLKYVEDGHYDGTIFHRVIGGFMIQGGSFTRNYAPRPTRPPVRLEARPDLPNTRGALAMARTSDPHSPQTSER